MWQYSAILQQNVIKQTPVLVLIPPPTKRQGVKPAHCLNAFPLARGGVCTLFFVPTVHLWFCVRLCPKTRFALLFILFNPFFCGPLFFVVVSICFHFTHNALAFACIDTLLSCPRACTTTRFRNCFWQVFPSILPGVCECVWVGWLRDVTNKGFCSCVAFFCCCFCDAVLCSLLLLRVENIVHAAQLILRRWVLSCSDTIAYELDGCVCLVCTCLLCHRFNCKVVQALYPFFVLLLSAMYHA